MNLNNISRNRSLMCTKYTTKKSKNPASMLKGISKKGKQMNKFTKGKALDRIAERAKNN